MAQIPRAARVTDTIKHTAAEESAMWGFFVGLVIGIAIAVAIVATGGAAALAIGALAVFSLACTAVSIALTAAVILSELAEFVGGFFPEKNEGRVAEGAETVFIELLAAARVEDPIDCDKHGHAPTVLRFGPMALLTPLLQTHEDTEEEKIAQGSETCSIEKKPAARFGDQTTRKGELEMGAKTVGIGGPKGTYLHIHELPEWFENFRTWTDRIAMVLGILGAATGGEAVLSWKLLTKPLTLGYMADLGLGALDAIGEHYHWSPWVMWPIKGVKSALELALIFKHPGKLPGGEFAEYREMRQITTETRELEQEANQIREVTGDAQRAEKLSEELRDAKGMHNLEEANQNVAREVEAYKHEPANVVGPKGEAIDHAGRPLPPENPPKIITDPNEPVLPKNTQPLFTGEPEPPPNAGQGLWYPGKPEPPPAGTHFIIP